MIRRRMGILTGLAVGLLALGSGGCVLASSLFDDQFLEGLGISTFQTNTSDGTIIVVVRNDTVYVGEMSILAFPTGQRSATSPTLSSTFPLAPGETGNRVFDCPTDIVSPGGFSDNAGGTDLIGARLFNVVLNPGEDGGGEGEIVEVAYLGSPILSGRDFNCGDVILISVAPAPFDPGADNAEVQFRLFIEIIPGA
jgi:hypothetical protein